MSNDPEASRKYRTLRLLGTALAWIGWFVGIGGVVAGIYGAQILGEGATIGTYLYIALILPLGMVIVGIGQAFQCLVSIEQNTRQGAQGESPNHQP